MRPFFMSYVRGEDRGQAALLPAAIEDYVAADAPVRVIDVFGDGLDMIGLGFGRSVPAVTGRPPYDPRDLLKLYLYGYLIGIGERLATPPLPHHRAYGSVPRRFESLANTRRTGTGGRAI